MNTAASAKTTETFADTNSAVILQEQEQDEQFSGSRQLFSIAAQEFGVLFDGYEVKDWEGLLAGAHLVDYLLDIENADMMKQISSIMAGRLRDDLSTKPQISFRNYMLRQPGDRYDDIIAQLKLVSPLVFRQSVSKDPGEVIAIRLEEADILTSMLSLPVEGRDDATARQQFNHWLAGWSRTGYMFDSLFDMNIDYNTGQSQVEPTIGARITIAKAAMKEGYDAARKTPPRLLGRCALVGVKYVLLNKKPQIKQHND